MGEGSRSLPGIIPDRDIDQCPACPPGTSLPASQQRAYAGAFKNVWTPNNTTAPPNFGVNGNIGDTFGPFGISLAGLWDYKYNTHPTEVANSFTSSQSAPSGLEPTDLFTYRRSTLTGHLGGVLTAAYTINPDNRINFRAFDNHVGQDYVLDGSGFDFNVNPEPHTASQTTLYYQQQNLGYSQLEGEHHFDVIDINWRSALSQTTLDAPDSRYLTRIQAGDDAGSLFPNSNSPLRTFLDVNEYLTDSAVDFTVPFKTGLPWTDVWSGLPAKAKFGPAYTYRNRNLNYRRFRYDVQNGGATNGQIVDTRGPAEEWLIPDNIGNPTGGNPRAFNFTEDTRATPTSSTPTGRSPASTG